MLWEESWLREAAPRQRTLWRGVEAQHRVATMRLVDDLDEQGVLEELLDASKPPMSPGSQGAHYLVSTPFRYASPWPSRFRRPFELGAWYGAEETATVAAETAYWRWRFLMDSDGLRDGQLITELTFFQARFVGVELDLMRAPWAAHRAVWRHPEDYSHCHRLAVEVRRVQPAIDAIRYESARAPGGHCEVVFQPASLSVTRPVVQQTWACKTTCTRVLLSHDDESHQFDMVAQSD
ncbi:RES family NAD+ phosphorylase [Ramlibacter sp.]|uniref:RES family NAD+ phosphorylase n=1 Tax=Ramlibacter sp. TaxID=1917967 RepID=UPI003D133429